MCITSSSPLSATFISRYITELPQKNYETLTCKARWQQTASKICIVAFLAIVALVFATAFGVMSSLPPVLVLALILSAIPLQFATIRLQENAALNRILATGEQGKAEELKKISHWSNEHVERFLETHGLRIQDLPLDALRQINPQEPLKALLPGIARFHYFAQEASDAFSRFQANLYNRAADKELQIVGRCQGWTILEEKALPSALQASFILHVIAHPTEERDLETIGQMSKKSFSQRVFDRWLDQKDEYFVFNTPEPSSITLTTLCNLTEKKDFDHLRQLLFHELTAKTTDSHTE